MEARSQTPTVSVIVPARDATRTLRATLDGLEAQRDAGMFEVIVVDNGSDDDTAEIADAHPLAPRVIRRRRGEGAGAARNDGVAASQGSILAFIDSDCVPTSTWISGGLRALDGVDLVSGAVRPPPDVPMGPFDRSLWVTREHGLYETANLFVRREWFERVDGFVDWVPDGAGPAGRPFGEDVWFAWRARRLGARTTFAPDAVVYHAVLRGTARQFVTETWRLRHFPDLIARVPELRGVFAWHRWFLNSRTAAFDLAAAGVFAAAVRRSAFPLVALAPYASFVWKDFRVWGKRRAIAGTARDTVGAAALVVGSVKARSPLL